MFEDTLKASKCADCYKAEGKCFYTARQKKQCEGPFEDKAALIRAVRQRFRTLAEERKRAWYGR